MQIKRGPLPDQAVHVRGRDSAEGAVGGHLHTLQVSGLDHIATHDRLSDRHHADRVPVQRDQIGRDRHERARVGDLGECRLSSQGRGGSRHDGVLLLVVVVEVMIQGTADQVPPRRRPPLSGEIVENLLVGLGHAVGD